MKLGEKEGKITESDLMHLKERYLVFQEKYSLPKFDELNEMFSIEKIDGNETDFLLREIRRIISEVFSNYINVLENLLNPTNVPLFVFSIVKVLDEKKKKKLSELYMAFSKEWIPLLQLDLRYNEANEAEFIRKAHIIWKKATEDFYEIAEFIKNNWDLSSESKMSGYLG